MSGEVDFTLPVKCADECEPCEMCGEPFCVECGLHYTDCKHPGPHSEEEAEQARHEPDLYDRYYWYLPKDVRGAIRKAGLLPENPKRLVT